MGNNYRILCINLGSTSTKLACFVGGEKVHEAGWDHPAEELNAYPTCLDQLPMRAGKIAACLDEWGCRPKDLDALAVRGGPQGIRYKAGAYLIDADMAALCRIPANSGHPMCLGPLIAYGYSEQYGIPAYSYDVVMADELEDVAKITAIPDIPRAGNCHVLNTRAVGREVAAQLGRRYEEMDLIIAHLGGGVSTSLHRRGRIVDAIASGNGSFSPSRCGIIAFRDMVRLCCRSGRTEEGLLQYLSSQTGFIAHLGTSDCRKVEEMIQAGDHHAALVYDAFVYNMAKDIATMAAAAKGKVDRIILTGGMAHSTLLTNKLTGYVAFIAPVSVYPGSIEMEALARGIGRVLAGEEHYHTIKENT